MKKRLCVLFVICCMLFGLAACGSDSGQTGADGGTVALQSRVNEDLIYFTSDLDLGLASNVNDVDFKVYGMNIYYPAAQSIVNYSLADGSKSEDVYQWADAPGEWAFERVCYSGSGEVYSVVKVSGADAGLYLCRFDTERKLKVAQPLRAYDKDAEGDFDASCRLEVGDDGRVYLSNSSVLWVLEEDLSHKDEIAFKGIEDVAVLDLQSAPDGTLYVLYEDKTSEEQYVAELDTEKAALTVSQKTIGLTGMHAFGDALLCFGTGGTFTYNREERTLTELFKWSECKLDGVSVYETRQLSDGRIFIAGIPTWGGVETFLIKSTQVEAPDVSMSGNESGKIDIRLALVGNPSAELSLAMHSFNKTNEKYNLIIETYMVDSKEEAIARLQAEFDAGKAPDLVEMGFGNVTSMVENGYLEDLSMWLAESEKISEGDFVNFALEEYNVDGTLAAIPHHFTLSLLGGNSEFVGDFPGWTMEGFLDFLEKHSDSYEGHKIFAYDCTLRGFIFMMLRTNNAYFLDRDACTCNFDNDIFRRMVEIAADYPVESDRSQNKPSAYMNLQNGSSLLCSVTIHNFMVLQPYEAALGGALTCIGYPVEEGVGIQAHSMNAIGISALSEHKEGAWQFLEYFLQYMKPDDSNYTYFLTYIPALEKMAEASMTSGRMSLTTKDGFQYAYHVPTREEVEEYFELINMAVPVQTDVGLADILEEEMSNYYAGEKTMEEMIASVESRVQLYLEESR